MNNLHRQVIAICFTLYAVFLPLVLSAQPLGIDTIHIPGFQYDPNFYIGYLGAGYDDDIIKVLYERLRADYTFLYGGPGKATLDRYRDTSLWFTDPVNRFKDSTEANFWLPRATYPVKAVYAPGHVFFGGRFITTSASYDLLDSKINSLFQYDGNGDILRPKFYVDYIKLDDSMHVVESRNWIEFDTLGGYLPASDTVEIDNQYLAGRIFPPCDSLPCDSPLVGWPKYSSLGLSHSFDLRQWFLDIGIEESDTVKYYDSTEVSFMISTDTSALNFTSLFASDTLAYAVLLRRDTTAQQWNWGASVPYCALYAPFDTVVITKGMYLDSANEYIHNRNDRYKEFFFPLRFPGAADGLVLPDTAVVHHTTKVLQHQVWYSGSLTVTYDTVDVYDTIRWGGGTWDPYIPADTNAVHWGEGVGNTYCEALADILVDAHVLPPGTINYQQAGPIESDFVWVIYTTGRVQLDVLGGRVAPVAFRILQQGRFDTLFTADIDSVLADPLLDTTILRFSMSDEIKKQTIPSDARVNAAVARHLISIDSTRSLSGFCNPIQDYTTIRIGLGDLDSTDYKPVQTMAAQAYYIGTSLPISYANPDSMSWRADSSYYHMTEVDHWDTIVENNKKVAVLLRDRYILGPNQPDYEYYLAATQERFGAVTNKFAALTATARTKLSQWTNPVPFPVAGVIQTQGYLDKKSDNTGYTGTFYSGWRPITPEEITAQCWLALNAGIDGGIIFGDWAFETNYVSVLNGYAIRDTVVEYDTISARYYPSYQSTAWDVPKMWLGFRSRYHTVVDIVDEFKDRILPVYTTLDLYNGQNFCVQAKPNWDTVTTIGSVRAERAVASNPSTNVATGLFDAPDSTYLEVALFRPGWKDTVGIADGSRFLIFTNRRMWPISFQTFSQSALTMLDTLAVFDTAASTDYSTTDFGRIDVRRPVVVLKNSWPFSVDSVEIEKVGYESLWNMTAAIGDSVAFDWLNPGGGAMYRIRPIQSSPHSTGSIAYNNAVHIENSQTDTTAGLQVMVYERDSAVWLRYSKSGWFKEYLLSDPADTVRNTNLGRRVANNTHPALAKTRNDTAWLVVWERSDTDQVGTVEALHISGRPDSVLPGGTRLRLSTPRLLDRPWKILTPAVVGMDTGWVAAWGSPTNGIEVMAIRNVAVPVDTIDLSAVSLVRAIKFRMKSRWGKAPVDVLIDSICKFPTLARFKDYEPIVIQTGPTTFTTVPAQQVALAWQQGADTFSTIQAMLNVTGPYIMYKPVHVRMGLTGRPLLTTSSFVEHVSYGLPGCRFFHPSIAVDSVNVGVAFESHVIWSPNYRIFPPYGSVYAPGNLITLRFRDEFQTGFGNSFTRSWTSPAYYWGDNQESWQFPSLMQFPAALRSELKNISPQGLLAWFDTDDSIHQYLYRYGEYQHTTLPVGAWPTLMAAPARSNEPMSATGVLYRDTDEVSRVHGWGETGLYYPGSLISSTTYGSNAYNAIFTPTSASKGISTNFSVKGWVPLTGGACDYPVVNAGMLIDIKEGDDFPDFHGHPSFFSDLIEDGPGIYEPEDAGTVARTPTFATTTQPLTLNRYVHRSDTVQTWLSGFPLDTVLNSPPDVKILTELVLVSNDSVLWRDDTLSVIAMTENDTVTYVHVPTDDVYPTGSLVYVRMRPVVTLDVEYDLSAGFSFYEGNVPPEPGAKRSIDRSIWQEERNEQMEGQADALRLSVVPNPARENAQLRVWSRDEGEVRVSIWSSQGELLKDLPIIQADASGLYTVVLDVHNVRTGVYIIRAEGEGTATSVELRVVR